MSCAPRNSTRKSTPRNRLRDGPCAVKSREAQVQALEAKEALEQSKEDSYDIPCDDEDRGNELNAKVNEVNEVNVSEVNVNANEVNDVNKVNESTVNEASGEVCNIKEVTSMSILKGNEVKI